MRNLKLRKFILKVFWSIIRKFAPTKISHYTVSDVCLINDVHLITRFTICFILSDVDAGHGKSSATGTHNRSTVAIARRNIRKIEGKFSMLVTNSQERLQSRINVKKFRIFLITMYSSPNSRDGSSTVTTVIKSTESLGEMFVAFGEYGLWDYLNYYLLQEIIEEFASDDDELNDMMVQYQRDLTGHVLTQKNSNIPGC